MPDESQKVSQLSDFSGAVQSTSSRFLQKDNELRDSQNARFKNVGAVGIRTGYAQTGSDLTSTTTTSTSTSTTTTTTSTSSSTSTTTTLITTSTSTTSTTTSTTTTTTSTTTTTTSTTTTVA